MFKLSLKHERFYYELITTHTRETTTDGLGRLLMDVQI